MFPTLSCPPIGPSRKPPALTKEQGATAAEESADPGGDQREGSAGSQGAAGSGVPGLPLVPSASRQEIKQDWGGELRGSPACLPPHPGDLLAAEPFFKPPQAPVLASLGHQGKCWKQQLSAALGPHLAPAGSVQPARASGRLPSIGSCCLLKGDSLNSIP